MTRIILAALLLAACTPADPNMEQYQCGNGFMPMYFNGSMMLIPQPVYCERAKQPSKK